MDDVVREEREVLALLVVAIAGAADVADLREVVHPSDDQRGGGAKCRRTSQRAVDRGDVGAEAVVGRRIGQRRVDGQRNAAVGEGAVVIAEPQIVTRFQLFIGVIGADQPVERVVEGRPVQAEFLGERLELARASIRPRRAIKQVDLRVVGVRTLEVRIFAIAGDRGQRDIAEIPVDLARKTPVFRLAVIGPPGGDVDIAVEGRLAQCARVLTETEQDRHDRIVRAGQRRTADRTVEAVETGRNTREWRKARLDEGRGAAGFFLLRIIAYQADAEVAVRLEQQLAADEVAVAIVDADVVHDIVVETVALEIDAVDPRGDRIAERRVDPGLDLDRVVIAIGESAVAGEFELGRGGVDVDQAGRRVTAAQRALRAAQDFDAVERPEFGHRIARTRPVDTVDEDRDRAFEAGVVADRTNATNTRGAIGFVAGRGDQQRRRHLVEVANIRDARLFEQFARDRRNRDRDIGQSLFAALRANDDDAAAIDIGGID